MKFTFSLFVACILATGCLTLSLEDLHSQGLQKSSLQKRVKDPRTKSSKSSNAATSKKVLELIREMENHLKSEEMINHHKLQSSKKIKRKQSKTPIFSGRRLLHETHPSIRKRSVHPPNDLMEGQYAYFIHQIPPDSEFQRDAQKTTHLRKRSPSRIVTDMRNKKMLGKKRKGRSFDNQSVMGELRNILKEDDEEKTIKKRRETSDKHDKQNFALNKTLASKDLHEKQKRESEGDLEEIEDKKVMDQKAFNEWLQREYYKNMAKSFATMRKKRAGWGPLVARKKNDQLPSEEEEEDKKHRGDSKNISNYKASDQFDDVIGKLKKIENALLTDALRLMESGEATNKQEIVDDLSAAYDLEIMTMAMDHLKSTLKKINTEERKENFIEKRKDTSELYNAEPPEEQIQYPWYPINKDEEEKTLTSDRPDDFNEEGKREEMLSHLLDLYNNYRGRAEEEDVDAGDKCPPLNLLTSDCSALTDIVEDGTLQQLLRHSCNWHEVCYSCGEAFGLTSEDCDAGFLHESHTICRDDLPCQTSARLLLLPLRQRRVFYKRSNPTVCYVDPCVEEFLRKG